MPLFHRNVCNRGSPPRHRLTALAAFISALFLAASANAATYYVATNGSDSNPGTQSAPFRTIAHGSQKMSGGDTLYIRAGTYSEAMIHGQNGFVFRNGTPGVYTRYAAYQGEKPVILPLSDVAGVLGFTRDSQYIEINGLVIDGTHATAADVLLHDGNGYNWAKNILITNNEIRNGRQGISGGGQSQIISNNIHGISGYGIYTGGINGLLARNIFHDNGGYAMHIFQQEPEHAPNGWVIRNNTIYNNGTGYSFGDAAGGAQFRKVQAVVIARGTDIQFYNNLVYNNNAGIYVGMGATNALIANNTVYGNNGIGINISNEYAGSTGAQVINNISWGNGGSQLTNTGTGTQLQNNVTTDPHVQNAAGGDFHLTSASTDAIDKGMTVAGVLNDFDYGKRPWPSGAAYDVGAFEFGSPPGTTPSPPIPAGAAIGGAPVFYAPDGSVCPSGYSSR
jgi:hypothetical protein